MRESTAIGNSDRANDNDGDFGSVVLAGKFYIRIRRKKDKVQTASSFHNLSFFCVRLKS